MSWIALTRLAEGVVDQAAEDLVPHGTCTPVGCSSHRGAGWIVVRGPGDCVAPLVLVQDRLRDYDGVSRRKQSSGSPRTAAISNLKETLRESPSDAGRRRPGSRRSVRACRRCLVFQDP